MNANFSSTQNTSNLIDLIEKIPSRGVPAKVNQLYLESLGYKSTNDRTITAVLKSLNVIESNGTPNSNYALLRNKETGKKALAVLLQKCYSELFQIYPDAQNQNNQKLQDYFASKTSVGEASLKNIILTFTSLCKVADFTGVINEQAKQPVQNSNFESNFPKTQIESSGTSSSFFNPNTSQVHFNIQVHIPGEQSPEIYESIFKNLGKYVLGIKETNK